MLGGAKWQGKVKTRGLPDRAGAGATEGYGTGEYELYGSADFQCH